MASPRRERVQDAAQLVRAIRREEEAVVTDESDEVSWWNSFRGGIFAGILYYVQKKIHMPAKIGNRIFRGLAHGNMN